MIQSTLFDQYPQKSYHNTLPITGSELKEANDKAKRQDDEVLQLFIHYKQLTPWQCEARLNSLGKKWPITSIRRSITNLTGAGKLVKTGVKVVGPLGSKENQWMVCC